MGNPVFAEATIARMEAANPNVQSRRGLVNLCYAEVARDVLGEDAPWCSGHGSVLSELGRLAQYDPERARLVAAELEADPPSAHTARLRVRQARNGTPEPQRNQLAVEVVNFAFDFAERYPATTNGQIISALDTAHRTIAKLHREGKL